MMYLMVLLSIQLQMKLDLQTFVTYKKKGRVCIGLCLQDLGEIRFCHMVDIFDLSLLSIFLLMEAEHTVMWIWRL